MCGVERGDDDSMHGAFQEAVCPVGEEVADVEEDGGEGNGGLGFGGGGGGGGAGGRGKECFGEVAGRDDGHGRPDFF